MSGIYLDVWDMDDSEWDVVLKPTKGGWPHITLAYTGKNLKLDQLKDIAVEVFRDWVKTHKVILIKAYVNSFEKSPGVWRHDCLLDVDDTTKNAIEKYRQTLLIDRYPKLSKQFAMHDPHITVGIHWSKEDAQKQVDMYNQSGLLPRTVDIIGVDI